RVVVGARDRETTVMTVERRGIRRDASSVADLALRAREVDLARARDARAFEATREPLLAVGVAGAGQPAGRADTVEAADVVHRVTDRAVEALEVAEALLHRRDAAQRPVVDAGAL